jgi:hypothetical protein
MGSPGRAGSGTPADDWRTRACAAAAQAGRGAGRGRSYVRGEDTRQPLGHPAPPPAPIRGPGLAGCTRTAAGRGGVMSGGMGVGVTTSLG